MPETLPAVPLRDVVVFPHMLIPFIVGRPQSIRALEHALERNNRVFVAAQHDASVDDPRPEEICTFGCVANVVQSLKMPDGNIKVIAEGIDRAQAVEWTEHQGFYRVLVKVLPRQPETGDDSETTMSRVVSLFEQYAKLKTDLHYDALIEAVRVNDAGKLADTISAYLLVGVNDKQNLLEIISPIERLNRLAGILAIEVDHAELDRRIEARVEKQLQKLRSEYWATERKKATQLEIDEIKTVLETNQLTKDVEEKSVRYLKRLEAMLDQTPGQTKVSTDAHTWATIALWSHARNESEFGERAGTPLSSTVPSHVEPEMEPDLLKKEIPWRNARSVFWALLGGFVGGLFLNRLEWLIGWFAP